MTVTLGVRTRCACTEASPHQSHAVTPTWPHPKLSPPPPLWGAWGPACTVEGLCLRPSRLPRILRTGVTGAETAQESDGSPHVGAAAGRALAVLACSSLASTVEPLERAVELREKRVFADDQTAEPIRGKLPAEPAFSSPGMTFLALP
eukprot:CAMPEP_0206246960 /NCGR_PEP_ID=MMETSP0047_2-20121206/19551_1 /ASSEMBLY_ACC=CAM_ASM_000192 /TAXON_ID=195065 /ORGANISM="Chroomonas mesostigmatica_cf, Strain CCMP1168" /LENGTH=147 /DNA_ID=CAMNT_0053672445 /DNA_START=232 /DNA_END=675 /DNA_ORIENTATION=-